MSTIMMWFKKTLLVAVVAALGLSALPAASVFALGLNDATTPPAPGQVSNDRLEKVWAREQAIYERLGRMFDQSDKVIANIQNLIDKAKSNGKDVSAVQSALDALAAAVKQAKPVYDSGISVITAHAGFDSTGKVTDATQARTTVKSVGDTLKQIRKLVEAPRKALREAVRAFRAANKPSRTPAPNQSGG